MDDKVHPVLKALGVGKKAWGKNTPPLWTLCAEQGEAFKPAPRPRWCVKKEDKACYSNAAATALYGTVVTATGTLDKYYCEGYAISDVAPIPIEHAWVCLADGTVVDPTWKNPEKCHYYGFAFTAVYPYATMRKHRQWGLGFANHLVAREWTDSKTGKLSIPKEALAVRARPTRSKRTALSR